MTKQSATRGIRNSNPGNIRKSKDKWQGLADSQPDSAFFTFKGPEWGIRALARVVIKYQDDYGLNTVRGIIDRWAPPVENDTDAYIRAVAKSMGVGPDEAINVQDYAVLKPLTVAIIAHENAGYRYPDAMVDKGLALAGVMPTGKTVVVKAPKPRAMLDAGVVATTAGSVAGVVVAGKAVIDAAAEAQNAAMPVLGVYAPIFGAIVMLAAFGVIGWRVYQRRAAEA